MKVLSPLFVPILTLFAMCITGCGGETPDEPREPEIEVPTPDLPQENLPVAGLSFNSITLSNKGDSFVCPIYGLTEDSWSVECEQSWCKVSNNDNMLRIMAEPNTDSKKRTANIAILHSNKQPICSITVNQCSMNEDPAIIDSISSKNTFYPMFTATWCPYSPEMDTTLIKIQKNWDYPILPMRIHVKDSELYTPLSIDLSNLYNNTTTPTGYFDNFFQVENLPAIPAWNLIWATISPHERYTELYSYIGCKSIMSEGKIDADVTIRPLESGKYRLLAFILEDGIVKPQMTLSGEISDYCHNSVLVGALTPVSGQEFDLSTQQKVISIGGAIPPNVNLSNLRLLVVLERNSAELNYSDKCWFADNCLSIPLGKAMNGGIENIYIGEEISN